MLPEASDMRIASCIGIFRVKVRSGVPIIPAPLPMVLSIIPTMKPTNGKKKTSNNFQTPF